MVIGGEGVCVIVIGREGVPLTGWRCAIGIGGEGVVWVGGWDWGEQVLIRVVGARTGSSGASTGSGGGTGSGGPKRLISRKLALAS